MRRRLVLMLRYQRRMRQSRARWDGTLGVRWLVREQIPLALVLDLPGLEFAATRLAALAG